MKRWIRAWGVSALAWLLVMGIGAAAIAGAGSGTSHKPTKPGASIEASDPQSPEVEPSESESPDVEASHSPGDTHGACVSHWAHQAKENGLKGADFGAFMSQVARSDETGADCAAPSPEPSSSPAASTRGHGHANAHSNHGHGDQTTGS